MNLYPILMLVVAVVLVILLLRILTAPLKLLFKLLLHAAIGFVSLLVLNFLGSFVGLSLPITGLSCLLSGVLGVPGVVLLLLFKYFL